MVEAHPTEGNWDRFLVSGVTVGTLFRLRYTCPTYEGPGFKRAFKQQRNCLTNDKFSRKPSGFGKLSADMVYRQVAQSACAQVVSGSFPHSPPAFTPLLSLLSGAQNRREGLKRFVIAVSGHLHHRPRHRGISWVAKGGGGDR